MDAVEYLKNEAKMIKIKQGVNTCGISCNECLFYKDNTGEDLNCDQFKAKYPEKAVEIVEKWAAEHPAKTRQSEFLKMFNAPFIKNESVVDIAPCSIDTEYKKECGRFNSCFECKKEYWLAEVEE